MKESLLHVAFSGTLLVPLCAVLCFCTAALFKHEVHESRVSLMARIATTAYLFFSALLLFTWLIHFQEGVKWDIGSIYRSGNDQIELTLFLDRAGVVFLAVTTLIAKVIVVFSRRYLHRDPGFRRFYLVLFLFLFGMTLLFCAGSFDLIFAAWEIIGLSSFLLIAFYWHRPAAIINAKRAYFIYRFCDVGLLAGALISHLIWHDANLFFDLTSGHLLESFSRVSLAEQWLLSSLILLPVIGKSAQFPLSFWLPKAMEGPTPSSAIFYGSISIHAGVFLLIRTSTIWSQTLYFTWVIFVVGTLTAVLSTLFARVQPSIKGQIGYASVGQVGLMLVELSFGWFDLVLLHFIGNAFLRCFQLLVSASVVAEQLQIHGALQGRKLLYGWSIESFIPRPLRSSIYVFALNEGYVEGFINKMGRRVFALARLANDTLRFGHGEPSLRPASVTLRSTAWFPFIALALYGADLIFGPMGAVPLSFLVLAMFLTLASFGEVLNPLSALRQSCFSHLALLLGFATNHSDRVSVLFYLCGFAASWLLVYDAYAYVLSRRRVELKSRFEGLFAQFPLASTIGLVGVLGLIGFPVATTFYADDLLLGHAAKMGILYVIVPSLIFILNGVTLVRLHARLFFGSRENENTDIDLDFSTRRALGHLVIFAAFNACAFVWV